MKVKTTASLLRINNVVVISDIHAGCRLALCPPGGATLDDGGRYMPSPIQLKLWEIWCEFWRWVPIATKGEPYVVVINGDALDGVHHNSTTQISQNLQDQENIAYEILQPVKERAAKFFMIRGTEAHVGKSAVQEESLAIRLGAERNASGQRSRYELWLEIGKGGLIHFAHHIGSTGSMAYETTAVMKELSEMYADSARWRNKAPNIIVRSHRHRHIEVRVPTSQGYGIAFVTAAFQLRTPFSYKIPGGRVSQPQIGGSLIRQSKRELFAQHFVKDIERSPSVRI